MKKVPTKIRINTKSTNKNSDAFYRILAGIMLVIAFVGILFLTSRSRSETQHVTRAPVDLTTLYLEVVDTNEARMQGLSGRDSLAPYDGMLFVFDEPGLYPFWMKEMKFPLDIIWINGDTVVDVATLPSPTEDQIVPPRHIPLVRADLVLELDAGQAAALGIATGMKIALP